MALSVPMLVPTLIAMTIATPIFPVAVVAISMPMAIAVMVVPVQSEQDATHQSIGIIVAVMGLCGRCYGHGDGQYSSKK